MVFEYINVFYYKKGLWLQKDWKCVSIFNELIKESIEYDGWFIYNKIVITDWKKRMKYYGPYLIKNWV